MRSDLLQDARSSSTLSLADHLKVLVDHLKRLSIALKAVVRLPTGFAPVHFNYLPNSQVYCLSSLFVY